MAGAGVGAFFLFGRPFFVDTTLSHSHPAYYVLADTSTDTTVEIRAKAQAVLRNAILQAARQQGYVAATPFQDDAISKAQWKWRSFVPPEEYSKRKRRTRLWLARERDEFLKEVRDHFQHPTPIMGTDIIGILFATATEFRSFSSATSRTIVLASNMANVTTGEHGIVLKSGKTSADIQSSLDDLANAGLIPNLQGVCVFVVDPGRLPDDPVDIEVERTIYEFWTRYFDKQHANARLETWGSTLNWPLTCRQTD